MFIEVNVTKAKLNVSFDTDKLPTASVEYVLRYGLTQAIVDTVAGVKRSDFESDELFQAEAAKRAPKRIDQINSGNVPEQRQASDPKTAESRKLASTLMASGITADEIAAFIASRKVSTVAPDSTFIHIESKKGKKAA